MVVHPIEKYMDTSSSKPFSVNYVLRTTNKHIRKSIEISIRKTVERIAEFDGNDEKSREVFKTLTALHALKKHFDDFQSENNESFVGSP